MKIFLLAMLLLIFTALGVFFSCKKDKPCSGCPGNNKPPTAIGGADQNIILPIASVLLDGRFSDDPDGKITGWQWSKLSGPASYRFDDASFAITWVSDLTSGIYQFELKVTDNAGAIGRDTVQITVAENPPPIANAGADISVTLSSCTAFGSADLDGSASFDPDNQFLNYSWQKVSGPPSFQITSGYTPKTKVQQLTAGIYAFELSVSDPQGLLSKDTVLVDVKAVMQEFDLDITINSIFTFYDNYEDCYYYPCYYYDQTWFEGRVSYAPIGDFYFYVQEYADTAVASDPVESFISLYGSNNNGKSAYGRSNVNFKKLIQRGGGVFTGSFTVTGGSAQGCNQNIFVNYPPLAITGNMDTTAHTVSLTIQGKIYF